MKLPAGAIDAHVHLWRYSAEAFDWIDDGMKTLRRDFGPEDWAAAAATGTGVGGAVLVQARQSLEENAFLLQAASRNARLLGVVGWVPLADPGVGAVLERLVEEPAVCGVRHVVQAEAEGFLLQNSFNNGLSLLEPLDLTYDLLLHAGQLQEATAFVDRHPRQRFVLDHMAKPAISAGTSDAAYRKWTEEMQEIARRDHVWCKLSGLVTEADWRGDGWTPGDLRPYVDVVLRAWGPRRLMWGSDWPVVTVAASYDRWASVAATLLGELSPAEQRDICRNVAVEFYGLAAV